MSKKNRDYWRQRYSILKNNLLNRSDDYKIRLQEQYEKAQKEAEDRINIFYQRFATNNNITFNEAKKMLNSNERKKFQMTLNEYIKKGKANAVSNLWIKELENASNIYHIDRLKALQIEIRQQIELLSSSKEKGMTDLFSGIYEDSYYGGIYEIQKGFNYGKPFAQLDTRKINAALIRPYDSTGLSFSEKIWNDRKALVQYLDTDFARSIMRGANPQTLSEELAKKFKTSVKNANRILISESANIASLGSQACFNELGVEEFENLETLDGNTCEECQDMDKTHFPMKDFQIGLNAAPFHPNCRGVQVPYFNDEFTANEQRFARDENGKGYYVPADMSYKEWKKEYIKIPENEDNDIIESNKKYIKPSGELDTDKIRQEIKNRLNASNGEQSHILNMLYYADNTTFKLDTNIRGAFAYSKYEDVIKYNPFSENFYNYNFITAIIHEISHRMDVLLYGSYENESFKKAVELCRKKTYNNKEQIENWFKDGGLYATDESLSDIFSALTSSDFNDILYTGHKFDYWKLNSDNYALEIFANISVIDLLGYKSKEEFKGIIRELYEAYKELVNG